MKKSPFYEAVSSKKFLHVFCATTETLIKYYLQGPVFIASLLVFQFKIIMHDYIPV